MATVMLILHLSTGLSLFWQWDMQVNNQVADAIQSGGNMKREGEKLK